MKLLLFLFSFLHRSGCQIKNWLYSLSLFRPKRAPLPVISVGNITFGGSEKTPLSMDIISFLLRSGFRTALISRGYKGNWEKMGGTLSDGRIILGSWKDSGDEAFMVAQNIPKAGVFIGRNRLLSCQKASEAGFELVVLDDGFQHRRLQRDLDIVLYNSGEKIALREFSSSLKRAHIILVKRGSEWKARINKKLPGIDIFEYTVMSKGFFRLGDRESIPAESFLGKKVLAFCGIARPERFQSLLDKEAIQPEVFLVFPDHHTYPHSSLQKIEDAYQTIKAEAAITTEKDTVKIAQSHFLDHLPIYFLKIDLSVDEEFYSRIARFTQSLS